MKKIFVISIIFLIFSNLVFAQNGRRDEYSLEITDYEKEILIEKGWIKYLNVEVKNSGNVYINNVEIFIAISYIVESIRRTGEYAGDISEIIINNIMKEEKS